MIDSLHVWLNVTALLMFVGAACYFSLGRYMTRD